jgi:hypothetical protein
VQQSGTAGPIEWGQYKGGADHKGAYETGKNLANDAYLTVHLRGQGSVASSTAGINCGNDCIERYARNTNVTLTATPASGTFQGWSGACLGQGNPCTLSIQKRTSVVARFSQQPLSVTINDGTLGSVASNPAGIACPGDCSEGFDEGANVTLTATPAATARFVGWSGACTGQLPNCTVSMASAKSVVANFAAKPRVTVTVTGQAGGRVTSSPAGIDCQAGSGTCTALFDINTSITLTAAETDEMGVQWSGACPYSGATCHLYFWSDSSEANVTATFATKRTLTVAKSGDTQGRIHSSLSGIDCGLTCSYRYRASDYVTLYWDQSEYDVTWSGACTGTNAYCSMYMSSDRAVTAQLTRRPLLTVTKSGSAESMVISTPDGIHCGFYCSTIEQRFARNTIVTLKAVPAAGEAVSWSGACSGNASTCMVTMDEAKTVNARFAPSVTLQVTRSGNGTVNSDPTGIDCATQCTAQFAAGISVALVATPASGHVFTGWQGACSGTASCSVTMDQSRFVSATFASQSLLGIAIAVTGNGMVTSDPAGAACGLGGSNCFPMFEAQTSVVLTAMADANSSFAGWSGDCSGTAFTCTVNMSTARAVGALFVTNSLLTVGVSGTGSVTSNPAGIDCGTQCSGAYATTSMVTLTAVASPGNQFVQWSGACADTGTTCLVQMDQARNVTATFRSTPAPAANTGKSGGGGGGFTIAWLVGLLLMTFATRARRSRGRNRKS